eukprot:6779359-Pyramimonas_sp.AAC.1
MVEILIGSDVYLFGEESAGVLGPDDAPEGAAGRSATTHAALDCGLGAPCRRGLERGDASNE